jgi:hypothetical protein
MLAKARPVPSRAADQDTDQGEETRGPVEEKTVQGPHSRLLNEDGDGEPEKQPQEEAALGSSLLVDAIRKWVALIVAHRVLRLGEY